MNFPCGFCKWPDMSKNVPIYMTTWNFYEELAPSIKHISDEASKRNLKMTFKPEENPFASQMYRQHQNRPNHLRKTNWTFTELYFQLE